MQASQCVEGWNLPRQIRAVGQAGPWASETERGGADAALIQHPCRQAAVERDWRSRHGRGALARSAGEELGQIAGDPWIGGRASGDAESGQHGSAHRRPAGKHGERNKEIARRTEDLRRAAADRHLILRADHEGDRDGARATGPDRVALRRLPLGATTAA